MATYQFTVDTKLFRELGELLVARDSIALAELIKNAYDADATEVRVYGESLRDPENGWIQITDDGVGMGDDEFRNGFLRIAGRTRSTPDRRSLHFKRRFTGAKGVGRLAAHKLAHLLEIQSWKWNGQQLADGRLAADEVGIDAHIDWDEVERQETLEQVAGTNAVRVGPIRGPKEAGTQITLRRLRKHWTVSSRSRFHNEVLTLSPLQLLTDPVPASYGKLLFARPKVRDAQGGGTSFSIELLGELKPPEELLAALPESAALLIEVDCDAGRGTVRFGVAPSPQFIQEFPDASKEVFEVPYAKALPDEVEDVSVSFQARIFERAGNVQQWPEFARGIRIYMEGFRVPPYGESTDDWLELKADYSKRASNGVSLRLERLGNLVPPGESGESVVVRPDQAYTGAVFLRHNSAPGLEMLINREGFLPSPSLHTLGHIVRTGIDIATRLRYSVTHKIKRARREEAREEVKRAVEEGNPRQSPVWHVIQSAIDEAATASHEAREAIAGGRYKAASSHILQLEEPLRRARTLVEEQGAEQAMLRVLASLGAQLSAFHHEIGGLLATAEALVERLEKIRARADLTSQQEQRLTKALETASGLRQALDRQAVYLIDVTSIDARRKRSRQALLDRFASASRLLARSVEDRNITIENELPPSAKTPPMFPAEVTMVLTNLLSNAIKAVGRAGTIQVSTRDTEQGLLFRMENTGAAVNLANAERFFDPFVTTTADINAALGQGMGLGLTITRSMLDEYGATISFVTPSKGFKTAIEIRFPKR